MPFLIFHFWKVFKYFLMYSLGYAVRNVGVKTVSAC